MSNLQQISDRLAVLEGETAEEQQARHESNQEARDKAAESDATGKK